ncbi:MAG: recombination-associated protein RdgC, partial [Comamonadaceae bacterium]|nr:recombination-associated protein RdgC [Comamonadaceae bacterium]
LAFQDTVFEGQTQDDAGFDADVAIATGELCKLIPDLIAALGGEGRGELGAAAPAADTALHAPANGVDDDAPF